MKGKILIGTTVVCVVAWCGGCQIAQSTTEVRSEEQMLEVSFENERCRELLSKIIYGIEPESTQVGGIGVGSVSLGTRYEQLSFNAHCNEHIRKMDTNGDRFITQVEAEKYFKSIESKINQK